MRHTRLRHQSVTQNAARHGGGIPDIILLKSDIPVRGEFEGPTPSNNWHIGYTRVCTPNDISIGSAVFAELTIVSNTQTDTQTSLRQRMRSNTPHRALVPATCAKSYRTYNGQSTLVTTIKIGSHRIAENVFLRFERL